MEYLNDVNDQVVLPLNQRGNSSASTVQLSAFEGHLQGQQPRPQITEPLIIVPGDVPPVQIQQMTAVAADQQLQVEDDIVVVDVEAIMEPLIPDNQANGNCLENLKSNPICQLRIICACCLFFAVLGIVIYPDDLFEANKTPSQLVTFISMVVAPIAFAAISLVGSFTSNPNKWLNCLTVFSKTNCKMLVCLVACLFGSWDK